MPDPTVIFQARLQDTGRIAKYIRESNRRISPRVREKAEEEFRRYYNAVKRAAPLGDHWTQSGDKYRTGEEGKGLLREGLEYRSYVGAMTYGQKDMVRVLVQDGPAKDPWGHTAADHATWVISGTRRHRIPPGGEAYMKFWWPRAPEEYLAQHRKKGSRSKLVVLRVVKRHPGEDANPFHETAWDEVGSVVERNLSERVSRVIKDDFDAAARMKLGFL